VGNGWPVFPVLFLFAPAPGFQPFWSRHADAAGIVSTPPPVNDAGAINFDGTEEAPRTG